MNATRLDTYQFVGRNSGAERSVLRRHVAALHPAHYAPLRFAHAPYGGDSTFGAN
ncbi:MAG: hypothetical protein U1F76_02435 [Candidatus Competibacteraceae bacterium]